MIKKVLHFISLLVAVAIIASSAMSGFSASAAGAECSLDITCSTRGKVYCNNTLIIASTSLLEGLSYYTVTAGDNVTLRAEPYDGYTFLYWVNMETERVFSFETEYSFTAATYLKLEAVFYAVSDGWHYVTYLNSSDNIIQGMECQVGIANEHVDDYIPFKDGYTWTDWSYSVEQIALSADNLLVYPLFQAENISYTVTAVAGEGGEQISSDEYNFFSVATVRAPATLNGENFSYWAVIDSERFIYDIVSYYSAYAFYVTHNTNLTAVYGNGSGTGIVTRIAADNPDYANQRVTVYSERSISTDYTVVQHGMLFTADPLLARSDTDFIIDPSNAAITKLTSKDNSNAGTYGVTKRNWVDEATINGQLKVVYPVLFFRSYVILKDSSGNVLDPIYSDFYVVDHYNAGSVSGDNSEDPYK